MNRFLLSFFLVIAVSSCDKNENSTNTNLDFSQSEIEQIIAKKREKGDTLVLPFKTLEKFLPASIDGYAQAGESVGELNNEGGMAWSVINKKYTKDNQKIKMSLADYNGAYGLFAGATAVLGMGSIDNDEEKSKSIKFQDGQIGWESYKKNSKEAFLIVAIDNRFLLTIEAENQSNTEEIKSIVDNLEIDELISLGN